MKVQAGFSSIAPRSSKAPGAAPAAPQDVPPGPTFEEFYAPQRRKELAVAAIPLYGAYHNISRATTNLLGFGTGGGYRVTAALCNLAGSASLVFGHVPLGLAGLAASTGFTYLHQHRG